MRWHTSLISIWNYSENKQNDLKSFLSGSEMFSCQLAAYNAAITSGQRLQQKKKMRTCTYYEKAWRYGTFSDSSFSTSRLILRNIKGFRIMWSLESWSRMNKNNIKLETKISTSRLIYARHIRKIIKHHIKNSTNPVQFLSERLAKQIR